MPCRARVEFLKSPWALSFLGGQRRPWNGEVGVFLPGLDCPVFEQRPVVSKMERTAHCSSAPLLPLPVARSTLRSTPTALQKAGRALEGGGLPFC